MNNKLTRKQAKYFLRKICKNISNTFNVDFKVKYLNNGTACFIYTQMILSVKFDCVASVILPNDPIYRMYFDSAEDMFETLMKPNVIIQFTPHNYEKKNIIAKDFI